MIKLSVTIITFNEEKNIARCIDSVKDVADEIVVVDSFSSDKTPEICAQKGVKFIQNPFGGHIEQKNFAIEAASNSYILSLDADEALSPELIEEVKQIKQQAQYEAYAFNRLTNYCGKWIKHCGWYPDTKVRLWNKEKGCWGGINPHDEVMMQSGVAVKYIRQNIEHYSYYTIWQHIDQVNKFTEIGAKQAFERGKTSNLLKILVKPFWKFIRDYFVKLGMLDGYYGFVISVISSHATFVKYLKMKELQKK